MAFGTIKFSTECLERDGLAPQLCLFFWSSGMPGDVIFALLAPA